LFCRGAPEWKMPNTNCWVPRPPAPNTYMARKCWLAEVLKHWTNSQLTNGYQLASQAPKSEWALATAIAASSTLRFTPSAAGDIPQLLQKLLFVTQANAPRRTVAPGLRHLQDGRHTSRTSLKPATGPSEMPMKHRPPGQNHRPKSFSGREPLL